MLKFHFVQTFLRLAVGTVVLALMLRTWLVMGLVEPVTVAGSSMAPTLQGAHVSAICPQCNSPFEVGAQFAEKAPFADCPHCEKRHIPLAGLVLRPSDHLWIDRTAYQRRSPRRGDVVVLRNPEGGLQLCVKRVVGLPGETVELRRGDVWINRRPWAKSLDQQCAVRQLVHREGEPSCRWHAGDSAGWRWHCETWESVLDAENLAANLRHPHPALSREDGGESSRIGSRVQWQWLRYVHEGDKPITDALAYNAGLTRQLNLVNDLMLSCQLKVRGTGSFAIDFRDGQQTYRVALQLSDEMWKVYRDEVLVAETKLAFRTRRRLRDKGVLVELSNCDRQLLLAIDSQVALRYPLGDSSPPAATNQSIAVGVKNLGVLVQKLTLYRDIYYLPQAVGFRGQPPPAVLRLGSDEYYLLGDNSPISLDSRNWRAVSGRLLVGRPLGVR